MNVRQVSQLETFYRPNGVQIVRLDQASLLTKLLVLLPIGCMTTASASEGGPYTLKNEKGIKNQPAAFGKQKIRGRMAR